MTRRILVFHVTRKQSWRHNVRVRNRILAVLVMKKFPFPLGIFNFVVFFYKRNQNVRNLNVGRDVADKHTENDLRRIITKGTFYRLFSGWPFNNTFDISRSPEINFV